MHTYTCATLGCNCHQCWIGYVANVTYAIGLVTLGSRGTPWKMALRRLRGISTFGR